MGFQMNATLQTACMVLNPVIQLLLIILLPSYGENVILLLRQWFQMFIA